MRLVLYMNYRRAPPSVITPPLLHSQVSFFESGSVSSITGGPIPTLDLHVSVHVYSTS